jgi:signal peptidase I
MARTARANPAQETIWQRFRGSTSYEWLKSLVIAVGLALIIRWTIAEPFRIPSGSMEPTLHGDPRPLHGDRVFVNKFVYGWRYPLNGTRIPLTSIRLNYADKRLWHRQDPKRFDIVVFKAVEQGAVHTTLVKRIIGLPGERVHIANGKVYINNQPLQLPPDMPPVEYTNPHRPDAVYGILTDDAHSLIPPDNYLLLGDNSDNSRDGRYFGWVSNERILGRVGCIWWPPSRWRDFTGFSETLWWKTIVVIVLGLLFVRIFMGRSWRHRVTTSGGKERSLHIYIDRLAYGLPLPLTKLRLIPWKRPSRGDLVLYANPKPSKEQPSLLLGRVAAMPGERVGHEKNKITVAGKPIDTAVFSASTYTPTAKSKAQGPDDHFFILGDEEDPEESPDSRSLGWVPYGKILGKARFIWWPFTRAGSTCGSMTEK